MSIGTQKEFLDIIYLKNTLAGLFVWTIMLVYHVEENSKGVRLDSKGPFQERSVRQYGWAP